MRSLILALILVGALYAISAHLVTLDGFQNAPPEYTGDIHPNETAVWVIIGIALALTAFSVVYLIQHNRKGGR